MFSYIVSVVKWFWKALSWVRILVLNLIFVGLIVLVVGSFGSSPKPRKAENSALVIAPSGKLVDQLSYNPSMIDALLTPTERPQETLVRDLTYAINKATKDDNISGIILHLDYMLSGGMSKVEEIGQAINSFKESGKPVVAYADSMNQQRYLLASYADEIYLNEMGTLYLTGFGNYRSYYKGLADKLKTRFHVFRVGEYKDAIEPFIRQDMSPESKEHIETWLNQLWQRYAGIIETHRGLNKGAIDNFVDELPSNMAALEGNSSQLLLDANLIDGSLSRLTLSSVLEGKFGLDKANENINTISLYEYIGNASLAPHYDDDNIGLIVAQGAIVGGHQPEGVIGSETLSQLIEKAREDKSLKALVIRVDSGGGSAFASEVIREQISKTKDSGLPVYISMGSLAASGGYWISAPATEIWATPTTLTGSIGVFGLIPNFSESLASIGITSDGVGTSSIADMMQIDRPMSEDTKKLIQSGVEHIYKKFIALVAEARDTSPKEIHEIAQGRVWSGETAQQLGLVDKLGSLDDVFKSAASQLGLDSYEIKEIRRELSPQEQFIRTLIEQASALGGSKLLSPLAKFASNETFAELAPLSIIGSREDSTILAACTFCISL